MVGRLFGTAWVAAGFLLAGCASPPAEEVDAGATYKVHVTASHEVTGETRKFGFSLLQDGKRVGQGEYLAGASTPGNQTEVLNATVMAGKIYLGVFPRTFHGGSFAVVDRVLDVTDCQTLVTFHVHILEDGASLTTSCD